MAFQHATKSNPCPICHKPNWCYPHQKDPNGYWCKRVDGFAPLGWHQTGAIDSAGDGRLFKLDSSRSNSEDRERKQAEWQAAEQQREANKREKRAKDFRHSLSPSQRDPLIRQLAKDLGLTSAHRRKLKEKRGLTDEQINEHCFFSIEKFDRDQQKVIDRLPKGFPGLRVSAKGHKSLHIETGIAIPTVDANGMMTGWQFAEDNPKPGTGKYKWGVDLHLTFSAETDKELPIQVVNAQKDKSKRNDVWLVEGTLKPIVAAYLHQISVVGASSGNFAASPQQTAIALSEYNRAIVAIDAGDVINPARRTHWKNQAQFLTELGIEVVWAWWGQETKDECDLDESKDLDIKELSNAEFLQLLTKYERLDKYKTLSTLEFAPNLKYNEQWVRTPKFKPGSICLVSSAMGTGKTEAIGKLFVEHRKLHPRAKRISLVYRINLGKAKSRRMDLQYIEDLKVGHGQDGASINNADDICMCVDSLHRLDLEEIPANSIVDLDEIEATLAHIAGGGTTGDRTAEIQVALTNLLHYVISTGGMIVGVEDSLSRITVDSLKYICPSISPDILVNNYNRFTYDVSLGGHTDTKDFAGIILDRLVSGKRLVVPTTSQKFGHKLQETVNELYPHLKVVRIDSQTTVEHSDFMHDPTVWCRENRPDLLIMSPAVESGVSIDDNDLNDPLFDEVIMYTANLGVRQHLQLANRVRSNVPRTIHSPKRLATAQGFYTQEANYRRHHRSKLKELMRNGVSENKSDLGAFYNRLQSQFETRDALSSAFNRKLLADELRSRGHFVTEKKWNDERAEYQAANPGFNYLSADSVGEELKNANARIVAKHSNALADSIVGNLTLIQARSVVESNTIRFDLKWAAKKVIWQDLLPSYPTDDAEHCVLLNDGKRLGKIDTRIVVRHQELAETSASIRTLSQSDRPYVINHRIPTQALYSQLCAPIKDDLDALAEMGQEYDSSHPTVIKIASYAVDRSKDFADLKRLTIKASAVDKNGNAIHTPACTVNKILRTMGYEVVVARKTLTGKIYKVERAADEHVVEKYEECRMAKLPTLKTKLEELIFRRSQSIDSANQPIQLDDVESYYEVDESEVGVELEIQKPSSLYSKDDMAYFAEYSIREKTRIDRTYLDESDRQREYRRMDEETEQYRWQLKWEQQQIRMSQVA